MVFRETHVLRPSFGQAVVELNGEHDLETKEMLAELLASLIEENDLVVVDISKAEFIDSSVLHNLLKADRLARASRVAVPDPARHGRDSRKGAGAERVARLPRGCP